MVTETISQDLADLLATKNFDTKYKDKAGNDCAAGEAVTFAFDWVGPSGKNYGTAVAVIGDENKLMFFFGDNLGRSIENPEDKKAWYSFLEQMSDFSTSHRYTWNPTDISQLKHTLAGMAAIKEGLFEGYYGTRKVSYMGEQTDARLVIKHNRMLGENDKRYRYVESLYIETGDGERFKLPFTKLAGGRAMLEHVRQGGKPYDIRGNHIAEIVTEMNLLARFNRASQSRVFEGSTQELVESAKNYYQSLQENLKHLSSSRGYTAYFESWSPADIGSEDTLVEDIKTLFVEQTLDARIESALPLLAKIQQQGTAMKEVNVFETWINRMTEGTWALPDTPEQEAKLQELMDQELIAGPDGINATEQLYDLVGDDHLFDLISAAAAADPNTNIWDNAEIVGRLGELGVDTSAITQRGAEQTPEPAQGVAEDQSGNDIRVYGNRQGYYVWTPTSPVLAITSDGQYQMDWPDMAGNEKKALQMVSQMGMKPVDFSTLPDNAKRTIGRKLFNQGVAEGAESQRYRVILTLTDDSAGPGETATRRVAIAAIGNNETDAIEHAKRALQTSNKYDGSRIVDARATPTMANEGETTRTPTGLVHRATDKYGAGEEPFNPFNPGKYARDLDSVNKQQVKDLDASMGINWKSHGPKGIEVDEGRMADTDAIIQSIIAGDIDPYDIMNHPQDPEEEYVARILEKEYEDVAIDHRLHPDDDFEQILDRVVDRLAQDYGHPMDEADTIHSFGETTVAGAVAPMSAELEEEDQWGQAKQDPMNYNAAITGSYYESEDPLARLKTLALSKQS